MSAVCAAEGPSLRLQGGFEVQRVGRLSIAVAGKAVQWAGQLQQLSLAVGVAVVTPCCDDQWGCAAGSTDDVVIAWTVGVGCQQQIAGLGTAESPGIEHNQAIEAPAAGKCCAASDCGVILSGVGCGRIQSDEHNMGCGTPRASQSIAILAAGREQGCALDRAAAERLATTAGSDA